MSEEAKTKIELYNDHFQNYKVYGIQKAQLIIADIPYNLGNYAYASSSEWYKDGNKKNGESDKAGKSFFDTDYNFKIPEFMHFVSTMLKKEPKETGQAGCLIVFCEFEQQFMLINEAKKYGFNHYINLVFRKNYSAQVLKANMKIVGNCEYAILLYREKLPKFRNNGKMFFNGVDIPENYCFDYDRDTSTVKLHPTQKSIPVLKNLIELFTDKGDIVIDPVAGSGTTLRAAAELGRNTYGFEIKKDMFKMAKEQMLANIQRDIYSFASVETKQASIFD
jgi:site-specific DNA-methyltransferase (adenine-specific)